MPSVRFKKKRIFADSKNDPHIMRKHKLNRLALLFVLAMTSHALRAQIPNGYYDNAVGKTGNQLKVA